VKTSKHNDVAREETRRLQIVEAIADDLPRVESTARLEARIDVEIPDGNGTVLVGSDAHIWPGPPTTAMSSFVWACKNLNPTIVCLNGDVLDGATISRFPRDSWAPRPNLVEELAACQAQLRAIRKASPDAEHIWTRGNHDARWEKALAGKVPEFEGIAGTRLADHFPDWQHCEVLELPGCTIKHRFGGGAGAARSNALKAGRSYVTGHLHALQVCALTDLQGTRFGVDTGTLAAVNGPQFAYCEHAPRDWRAGWVLLTWQGGRLIYPEPALVTDEQAGEFSFRGQLHTVER
jgi:hypothetical protein